MYKKIGVIIVDDDLVGRRTIKHHIAQHPSLTLLAETDSASAGVAKITEKKPDAIFLDIQMPGITGLEMLRSMRAPPRVVFVTSSPNHALEAIEIEAVDYIVKPVTEERFAATVLRLERLFRPEHTTPVRLEKVDRLCLRANGNTHIVPINQIVALHADGDFTRVYRTNNPSILVCQTLGRYAEILPDPPFVRLDRSLIVNMDRLVRACRKSRSASTLWLQGAEDPIKLGRTGTERLQKVLQDTSQIAVEKGP